MNHPATRGRPPAQIDLAMLEDLAGLGLNVVHLAARLGVAKSTLMARLAEDPAAQGAYDRGRAAGVERAARGLRGHIEKGNIHALALYLRCVGHWRQNDEPPQVVVNVGSQPASISVDVINEMAERQACLLAGGED